MEETETVVPEMTIQERVEIWRQKAAEGSLTVEEAREIVKYLRADRMSAAVSAKAKGKTSREPVDISDL